MPLHLAVRTLTVRQLTVAYHDSKPGAAWMDRTRVVKAARVLLAVAIFTATILLGTTASVDFVRWLVSSLQR